MYLKKNKISSLELESPIGKLRFVRSLASRALVGISILRKFLLLSGTAQADQQSHTINSIVPELINLPGNYELIIPFDTFEIDQSKLEHYINGKEVVFSELVSTRVRSIRIDPPDCSGCPFRVHTYAVEGHASGPQTRQSASSYQVLRQFEARLVHGLRGPYCSLEISGKRHNGTSYARFEEYYLVLALGLKDEESLWLGPVDTPADETWGKYISFMLVKIPD